MEMLLAVAVVVVELVETNFGVANSKNNYCCLVPYFYCYHSNVEVAVAYGNLSSASLRLDYVRNARNLSFVVQKAATRGLLLVTCLDCVALQELVSTLEEVFERVAVVELWTFAARTGNLEPFLWLP
jgi:hypothetical protein